MPAFRRTTVREASSATCLSSGRGSLGAGWIALLMMASAFVTIDAGAQAPAAKAKSGSSQTKPAAPTSAAIPAILTDAPTVPPPITRRQPAKVVVELEVSEVNLPMADGVDYTFWTFGGKVPGKFIRVRQGDTVEFHLMNHPESRFPHNIDLHAVTGPGGGAASSNTAPGRRTQFPVKTLNAGLEVGSRSHAGH